jgi:GTPase
MADQSLAQRLLAGDKRALARGITLVESDDPAGWELVREVYPKTGRAAIFGLTGAPGAGKSTLTARSLSCRSTRRRRSPTARCSAIASA